MVEVVIAVLLVVVGVCAIGALLCCAVAAYYWRDAEKHWDRIIRR